MAEGGTSNLADGNRLPSGVSLLSVVALGVIAVVWFPFASLFGFNGPNWTTSSLPDWGYILLLAVPGLLPAFATWVLVRRAHKASLETRRSGSASRQLPAAAPTRAKVHGAKWAGRMAGGAVIALAAGLQGVFVLFMTTIGGVNAAGATFLVCELAPAVLGGVLGWWVIQRAQVAATGTEERPGPGDRAVRGAAFGIAIVCVLAEALWGVAGLLLYGFFSPWAAGPSFSLGGVAFTIGPCLVLLAVAAWLMYAAICITPEAGR